MHAVYTGTAVGRTVSNGVVVWTRNGQSITKITNGALVRSRRW